MDIDEDYDTYSGDEEFDENSLTNEEYDNLYAILPKAKEALKSYNRNIDELSIKEALYYNYFELEPALEELRSKFPKLKDDPPAKLSKLAMLAKLREKKSALFQPAADSSPKSGSKLLDLAKSRGSGLAGLAGSNTANEKPRLIRKTNLGLRKRLLKPDLQPKAKVIEDDVLEPAKPTEKRKREDEISIRFELSVQSALLSLPESQISHILFESIPLDLHQNNIKRRQLASELFHAYTNRDPTVKAKANFNQPSPDDKVLEAQRQAFSDLNKLSIKDEKDSEPKEKKIPAATKPFKSIDVTKELAKPDYAKPTKSFVIIGHVDAGKSTLMGRILYDIGTVDAKTVNKLVREAEKSGKGSFALAWIMDQTTEERSRGVTIDICATNFETSSTKFTAIDAPGHKDFVPQMIGGVSQADLALLVVDSITGEFEAGFVMDGQTKEHTLLAKNLGIDNIVVAVNKMDKEKWSEERFEDIKTQLLQFLTSEDVGFLAENISFVPISGLTGVNVVKKETVPELKWYKGPTLIDCLESIRIPGTATESLEKADFNLAINDIYDVSGSDFKIRGKITLGMIQPGQTVVIHPTDEYLQVQSLLLNDKPIDVAIRGQIISASFKINQLSTKSTDNLSIGDIVLNVGSKLHSTKIFEATVHMFNMDKPLLVGTPFVLFRNNASVAARLTKIIKIAGSKKKKMHLVSKQTADVEIEVLDDRSLPITTFSDNKALGRIVIRREGSTIGAGVVTKT